MYPNSRPRPGRGSADTTLHQLADLRCKKTHFQRVSFWCTQVGEILSKVQTWTAVGFVDRRCSTVPVSDLYLTFFLSPSHHLSAQLTSLELQYVSPKLLMCRDLELAVPGTYDPNQPIIRIQSIAPSLQVITSKQRPRKLTIMGKKIGRKGKKILLPNAPYMRGK